MNAPYHFARLTRRHLLGVGLGVAGSLVAACSRAPATTTPASAPTKPVTGSQSAVTPAGAATTGGKVTVSWLLRSDMGPLINKWEQDTKKEYQEAHSNVTVNVIGVPWGDYNAKLLAMFAANQIPEVFANFAAGFGTFLANGALADISSYLQTDKLDPSSIFEKAAVDALTRGGKLRALPIGHFGTHLFFNASLFEKAGVKVPPSVWSDKEWTIEAMLAAAKKMSHDIKDPAKGEWGAIFTAQQLGVMSWLWGVDPFNTQGGPEKTTAYQTGVVTEVHYDNPKFVNAMQWIADIGLKEKAGPLPSDINALQQGVGDAFLTGRLGMFLNGQWEIQNIKKLNPKWKWGIAPLPYGPAVVNTSPLYNDSFMLGKGAKRVEEGYRFLKYLTTDKPSEAYAISTGFFPARRDLYDKATEAYAKITGATQTKDQIKTIIVGAFEQGYATPGKTIDRYVELNNAWNQTSAPLWNGQANASETMKQVQAKFENLIKSR